ncbi:MAG: hypothetical protein M1816_001096 [Peltula sp. TS41687]|nr:MAG: hypothetical protein M1816_001096 [Peltula sp. TS41687]
MASSFWEEDKYRIHFFCAFCGGPFARVYRTDDDPKWGREECAASFDGTYDDDITCTVPKEWNRQFSDEDLVHDALPLTETEPEEDVNVNGQVLPGSAGASNAVWRAYDGQEIDEEDMKWMKVVRALIHRNAQVHPEGGLQLLGNERDVYLTGRGRVIENGSWAVAYPSIMDDLEHEDDDALSLGDRSSYRYHLYQEPDRTDRRFQISSIPFHEECWDTFCGAIRSSQQARHLEITQATDVVSVDRIWSYLCGMIPTAMVGGLSDLTSESLASGTAEDPITRLSIGCMGRMGYRQAQLSADGAFWRHIEGLHWLAANPRYWFPFIPWTIESGKQAESLQSSLIHKYNHTIDPFRALPAEVLVETFRYLSCTDIFHWRAASLEVNLVAIPQREYRRFYLEEMSYLPALHEDRLYSERCKLEDQPGMLIDWKRTFQDASEEWRKRNRAGNRRRIWKIVYAMAEELVETSSQHIRAISGLTEEVSAAISVVRGNVGIRSGADGEYCTVVFSDLLRPRSDLEGRDQSGRIPAPAGTTWPASEDHTTTPEGFSHALVKIMIWLHPEKNHVCGLRFVFLNERSRSLSDHVPTNILGTRTALCYSFSVANANDVLTGFQVCWAHGYLRGIRFIFEDMLKEPTEYCEAEYLSPCYGRWDGPIRRLVARRKFRTLAGVTAFVTGSGLIETFAILEKKRPVMNAGHHYLLSPPDTVPLSHYEASLWKCLPPNDVDILERLGPTIADWRTWTAQCQVFAPTGLYQPPGSISRIVQYSDGVHLVGVRFLYKSEDGVTTNRDLGNCDGKADVGISFKPGEEVSQAVIGHGRMGIHSLQLHRIVQLGIITRAISPAANVAEPTGHASASPSAGLALPFVDIDELSNPWVDGSPPWHFARGRKNSDSLKILRPASSATFAGWISLRDSISSVTVYGQMQGVRFTYADEGRSDCYFGDTSPSLPKQTQSFSQNSKRPFQYISHRRSHTKHDKWGHLPIVRLSRDNPTKDPMLALEVFSRYLTAIKFHFSADRIVDWQPLFDYRASPNERKEAWKSAEVMQSHPFARADNDLQDHYPVLADFLTWGTPETRVDGITGYCMNTITDEVVDGLRCDVATKRFCGLRFLRQGLCDEEPLGRASAHEQTFHFSPREEIVSISICGAGEFNVRGAIAFTTNFGRTTPWIGDPGRNKPTVKTPPPGNKIVGFYLAFSGPRYLNTVGIIYAPAGESRKDDLGLPLPPPPPNRNPLTRGVDAITVDWTLDSHFPLSDHVVAKSIGEGLSAIAAKKFRRPATTHVTPRHLEHVEAYVNTVQGRYGLKALRFHHNRRTGPKMLGDWQEERARPIPEQKMQIKGAEGERMVGFKFTFQKHNQGNRLIGFLIKTNRGREQDIVDWAPYTKESPPESEIYTEEFTCPDNMEIVGFQYLSKLYVHDIAVITAPKLGPLPRSSEACLPTILD